MGIARPTDRRRRRLPGLLTALALCGWAGPLAAQQALDSPGRGQFKPGGTLVGQLTGYLGQGTFVSNRYARNPYFAWTFTGLPSYRPHEDWTFSAYFAVIQELTDSDSEGGGSGSLSDAELVPEERRVVLSDLQLQARYNLGAIPLAEILTSLDGRIILPTSNASQFRTLLFGARIQLNLSRSFGPVTVVYNSNLRKNFFRNSTAVIDPEDEGGVPLAVARDGGAEALDSGIALPQDNVNFSLFNQVLVSYQPWDVFSAGISYGILNRFGHRDFPRDEYTSMYARAGLPRTDLAVGTLFVSYQIIPQLALEGGLSMVAPPKSSDNRSFRFPFFDFESPANNYGAFFVSLTGSQPFGD